MGDRIKTRLKDHAGRVHEVDLSRNDLPPATRQSDADPVAQARIALSRLETELQRPALGLHTLFWIAVWIAAGTLAWFAGIPLWISLPGMAIGAALLLAAVNALRPDREPRPADSPAHRAFVEAALAARLCPACAYPLAEPPDDANTGDTCSECGAVWHSEWRRSQAGATGAPAGPQRGLAAALPRALGLQAGRPIIEDARGRRVPLTRPALERTPDGATTADARRVYAAERSVRRMEHWGRLFVLIPAGVLVLALALLASSYGLAIGRALFIVVLLPTLIAGLVLASRIHRKRLARIVLRRAICPSCCEVLLDVESDADGLTSCPRCAAAWDFGPTCIRCGYPLFGLKPESADVTCPECGLVNRG